jgi:hypothetical protein
MSTCYDNRSSHPTWPFSFSLLDSLSGCLRSPRLRAASAGFGLSYLATAFMNDPD